MRPIDKSSPQATPAVTVAIGASGYTTQVNTRGHTLQTDEPESVGGMNAGPTPYELLVAAIGSCVAMTLRVYADRKGWPLTGVVVGLNQNRVHAQDCSDCESISGLVLRITKQIELQGDLDDEQRSRLIEVADRCPVQRSLFSEIQIKTELMVEGPHPA